jgi:Protein of unknown function, DUF547
VILAIAFLAASVPDTLSWDSVLKKHVLDNGAVRYVALKQDSAALEKFVAQIGEVSPHSHPALFPSREAKLAYWINAYNALVVWSFTKDYPEKRDRLHSAWGKINFFFRLKFRVGGEMRTLDDIEKNTIRKEFGDPRIHFAIVCASASCPWLARDAYTAANLDGILDRETRRYMSQERNVKLDKARQELTVSEIFKWFREDFGRSETDVIRFIAKYRADGPDFANPGWKIKYYPYNWTLNEAK